MHLAGADDAAHIRDALEASVFFASSMGRLGVDFTPQLAPIFESRIHDLVVKPWSEGRLQLKETLTICADAGVAFPLVTQLSTVESALDGADVGDIPLEDPQPPPRQLMTLPPLARLVNAILTGVSALLLNVSSSCSLDVSL
jgi:hypothetical protein